MKNLNTFFILSLFLSLSQYSLFADEDEHHKGHSHAKIQLCKSHKLNKSECFICDASLRTKGRLWCKEHDRYEDRCWLCHPELQDKKRMWCKEHSLYEDECFFCHPEIKKKKQGKDLKHQCKKHGLDIKSCYICDASLRTKGRLWCKEHDRYENRCWLCHPELHDKKRPFCKEHHLYEDECIFCKPDLIKEPKGADASKKEPVLFCNEHQVLERECGICQPQLAKELSSGQSMKIRFASKGSVVKAGVRTALPEKSLSTPYIESYCQTRYNENKYAKISPLASGIVKRVFVNVGQKVKKGHVLAELHSIKIAEAKADFLAAIVDHQLKEKTFQREKKLNREKASSLRELQESEALVKTAFFHKKTARQRLNNYGFTSENIKKIVEEHDSSSRVNIIAPFDGTILERKAVIGEAVIMGDALFTVSDLSNMWLELTIPSDLVSQVETGLEVSARFQGIHAENLKGQLIWVDTHVDENSRMVKARAVISNKKGKLKSGLFGMAKVIIESPKQALRVPKGAIHQMEQQSYVFVKVEDDLYGMTKVNIGSKGKDNINIIDGIKETDNIVVEGTFTMVSEYFKSRLGAGCVDD